MSGSRARTEPARGTLVRKIRALKKSGYSHTEIARRVGCDSQNVDQIVRRWSVRPWWNESNGYVPMSVEPARVNKRPNRGSAIWKMRELYLQGLPVREIARRVGIRHPAAFTSIKRWKARPWWTETDQPQPQKPPKAEKKTSMPDLSSKYLAIIKSIVAVLDAPIPDNAKTAAITAILGEAGHWAGNT